jgi:hypothetical protein
MGKSYRELDEGPRDFISRPRGLACTAGSSNAMRTAIIAITANSSIRGKPDFP